MKRIYLCLFVLFILGCQSAARDSQVQPPVQQPVVQPAAQPSAADIGQQDIQDIDSLNTELDDADLNSVDKDLANINW